jgi:hypothetical protein
VEIPREQAPIRTKVVINHGRVVAAVQTQEEERALIRAVIRLGLVAAAAVRTQEEEPALIRAVIRLGLVVVAVAQTQEVALAPIKATVHIGQVAVAARIWAAALAPIKIVVRIGPEPIRAPIKADIQIIQEARDQAEATDTETLDMATAAIAGRTGEAAGHAVGR